MQFRAEPPATSPTLGFTGDVMLGHTVDEHLCDRPPDAVWGSALPASGSGDLERLALRPVEIDYLVVETVTGERARWWRERMRERLEFFDTAAAYRRTSAGLALAL